MSIPHSSGVTRCGRVPGTRVPIRKISKCGIPRNSDKMRSALLEELLATDLADYLVHKGMPFRKAHHVVGEVVQHASQNTMQLSEIKLHELQKISDSFEEDVVNVFDFDLAVARKKAVGGTAPEAVRQQIKIAMQHIALHE